jgi:hypothetical protein
MPQATETAPSVPFDALPHVLLAMATVVVAARLLGILFCPTPPPTGRATRGQ